MDRTLNLQNHHKTRQDLQSQTLYTTTLDIESQRKHRVV
jgi:hypothetical protein